MTQTVRIINGGLDNWGDNGGIVLVGTIDPSHLHHLLVDPSYQREIETRSTSGRLPSSSPSPVA